MDNEVIEPMTTEEVKAYFGGVKNLSRELDCWPTSISRWGVHPPISIQYKLQVITDGKLKAARPEKQ